MHPFVAAPRFHHRRALLASAFLAAVAPLAVLAQAKRPETEPNLLAGTVAISRLRMLTDRVTKLVIQLQLKVGAERAQRLLDQSYAQIATAIDTTKRAATTQALRDRAGSIERALAPFLQRARAASGASGLGALAIEADVIIEQAEELTKLFEAESRHTTDASANRAGRIRMLTQHLPVHYFLTLAGINAEENRKEISRARGEFTEILRQLERAPDRTEQIERNLLIVSSQWAFMDRALAMTTRDDSLMRDVAATSERILETVDVLTGQYEATLKLRTAR